MTFDVPLASDFEAQLFDILADGIDPSDDEIVSPDEIELHAPKAFEFLEKERARYKVLWGGRAGAKSWQIARAILKHAAKRKLRILCAREFQVSIGDSVHKLLSDQIDLMGLTALFDVKQTTIRGVNGSEFIFKGLRRNIREIKSLEGIDLCWCEEAEAVSSESWRILLSTIRKEDSEIWVSFNPYEEHDPTYMMYVKKPEDLDGKAIVKKVSWRDNPYLSQTALNRIRKMQTTDPDLFMHEYEGECWSRSDAQVFSGKWEIDEFEPTPTWNGPYFGMDFGLRDPNALTQSFIHANKLWIRREAGGPEIPLSQMYNRIFQTIPGSLAHVIRCDSSRPETIQYLKAEHNIRAVAAEKWHGSVEDGIAYMCSFDKIVIHPSCKETAREFRLYRYKIDRLTNDVLPKIEDAHNHFVDAIRYSLTPMIRQRPTPQVSFFNVEM